MGQTELESLRPTLLAIPAEDVDAPNLPMAVALQEAHDLHTLASDAAVRTKLLAVGIRAEDVDALHTAVVAARQAQSAWVVVRDRSKSDAQKQREAAGYALRADLLAACRWNLRADRVARATVQAIAEGEGVADLIQDLVDLAALVERHPGAFGGDTTFDAATQVSAARDRAAELEAGTSAERLETTQREAKDLRDRAYTYLDDRVALLREAGRYAYRDDEATWRRFTSEYRRRHRRRGASAAAASDSEGSAGEGATPAQ
jgi:hypothetical protein